MNTEYKYIMIDQRRTIEALRASEKTAFRRALIFATINCIVIGAMVGVLAP